jgi:hypothetical protein
MPFLELRVVLHGWLQATNNAQVIVIKESSSPCSSHCLEPLLGCRHPMKAPVAPFLFALALYLPLPAQALPWGWAPQYDAYEILAPHHKYSAFVIYPQDVRRVVESSPERLRQAVWSALHHNWRDSSYLLFLAAEFVRKQYFRSGVFNENTGPGLKGGLEHLARGDSPIILITKHNDPYEIYLTISVGKDYGRGVPSVERLWGRGLTYTPAMEPTIGPATVRFIPKEGSLIVDQAITAGLRRRQFVQGGTAEIKTFASAEASPEDFVPLIIRLLVAHQFLLWGGQPADASLLAKLPGLSADQRREMDSLASSLESGISPALLYPEMQTHPLVTQILLLTLAPNKIPFRDPWMHHYQKNYGFGPVLFTGRDPDRSDAIAQIASISREDFEDKTLKLLEHRPGIELVRKSKLKLELNRGAMDISRCGLAVLGEFRLAPDIGYDLTNYLSVECR